MDDDQGEMGEVRSQRRRRPRALEPGWQRGRAPQPPPPAHSRAATPSTQAPGHPVPGHAEDSTQPSLASLDQTVAQLQDQLEQLEDHVNNLRVACFAVASQTTYLVRAFLDTAGMHQPAAGQASAIEALTSRGTGNAVTASVGTVVAGTAPGRALPSDILQQLRASLAAMHDLEQAFRQRTAPQPQSPSGGGPAHPHATRH